MVASRVRPTRDSRIEAALAPPQPPITAPADLSLQHWKAHCLDLWRHSRHESIEAVPAAVSFAFFRAGQANGLPGVISLSPAQLLWLATPGDQLLLSDSSQHRSYSVVAVDAASGALTLHGDPTGDKLRTVEFERIAVGLETLDTPALLERFLEAFPEERRNYRLLAQFGAAVLHSERDHLAPIAAAWFDQALFAALIASNDEREEIAAQFYCALTIALHKSRPQPEALAAKPFADRLYRLLLDHTEAALQRRLTPDQICRMAAAAAWSQDFVRASQFLVLALHRAPGHPRALQLRAAAAFHQRKYEEAIDDALQALESATRQQPAPAAGQYTSIYGVLTAACVGAGRWYEAKRHALDWQRIGPNDASPLAILARVEEQAGNRAAARDYYLQAAALAGDPARKQGFADLAGQMSAPAPSS